MKNLFIVLLIILFPIPSFSEDRCKLADAEYVPGPGFKYGEPALDFKIKVRENKDYVPSSYGTELYFDLNTSDTKTKDLLNTLSIPYICAGGSLPTCALQPMKNQQNKPPVLLYLTALNKDFSIANLNDKAPFALVISNVQNVFYRMNWQQVENFTYHKEIKNKNYYRPVFVPEVWVLDHCN